MNANTPLAIWSRIVEAAEPPLTRQTALFLLRLTLGPTDQARITELEPRFFVETLQRLAGGDLVLPV